LKADIRTCLSAALFLGASLLCSAAEPKPKPAQSSPQPPTYVIVNQDQGFPYPNQIAVFLAGGTDTAPSLTLQNQFYTGGFGSYGGYFGLPRVASAPDVNTNCVYVSNSGDNTISAFALDAQEFVGTYSGSPTDDGMPNGIGMAVNANYLYAGYSASQTIGVFAASPGCGLTYLQDVAAVGKNGGGPTGIAVNANVLVVTYGDGSIQSFDVTKGIPLANNDLQNSLGYAGPVTGLNSPLGNIPNGTDISQDGHWAIFGDTSTLSLVEVSSLFTLAHTQLARTRPFYTLGRNVDAGDVRLSPDGTLLYIVNNESGTVTAAFFNTATGLLTPGCTSPPLRNFNFLPWYGQLATRDTTGTGKVLYVAEFGRYVDEMGPPSAVGILTITVNGNTCTLAESPNSPVTVPLSGALSLGAYPPRPY
jgi:DNA-binding beta-propeller fold protein YncE